MTRHQGAPPPPLTRTPSTRPPPTPGISCPAATAPWARASTTGRRQSYPPISSSTLIHPRTSNGCWPAAPDESAYDLAYAPVGTNVEKLVAVVGSSWTIEDCFQSAKGQCGLDECCSAPCRWSTCPASSVPPPFALHLRPGSGLVSSRTWWSFGPGRSTFVMRSDYPSAPTPTAPRKHLWRRSRSSHAPSSSATTRAAVPPGTAHYASEQSPLEGRTRRRSHVAVKGDATAGPGHQAASSCRPTMRRSAAG